MIIPNSIKWKVTINCILGMWVKIINNISEKQHKKFRKGEYEKILLIFILCIKESFWPTR